MNLITNVDIYLQMATVYDLSTGLPIANMPTTGMTYQEAVDLAEQMATDLLAEQDRQDDPHFASQGINWRPQ